MKKLIFIIGLFVSLNISAQTPITVGMTGAQTRAALNANFGITDTAEFSLVKFRNTTSGAYGVIFKEGIPWMHDYPGLHEGGGYLAGQISAMRGKNLFIGKWSGSKFASRTGKENSMNTGVGDSTLASLTVGEWNTALGSSSLSKLTTGLLNTAVGRNSMLNFVTGHSNTSVGESSLERLNNSTPSGNTAVGTNAGMYLYKGNNNTLIGFNAGYGATNAPTYVSALSDYSEVIAIGANSLSSARYGSDIISIGSSAMGSTRNPGSHVIAIGTRSLVYSKGNYNIGIGGYNAETDTLGAFNVWLGFSGGRNAYDAHRNLTAGYGAGWSITTGDDMVCVGNSAGFSSTTASKSVYLGPTAGYYETGSSKLFIDNATRASEADARVKALIYGEFDAAPVNQRVTLNAVLTLTPMADPPGTPAEGMIYCDTDHHIYYYNGSQWKQLDN